MTKDRDLSTVTGPARLLRANLRYPSARFPGSAAKYHATLAFDAARSRHTLENLRHIARCAGRERWPDGALDELVRENRLQVPWRKDSGNASITLVSASNPDMPETVDAQQQPLDPAMVTEGAIVRAVLTARTFSRNGVARIYFRLDCLQQLAAGLNGPAARRQLVRRFGEPSHDSDGGSWLA